MSITLDEGGVWDNNRLVIQDSNASLSFFGHVSGVIDARHSAAMSIICKAYDPSSSCNGLVLEPPEYMDVNGTKKYLAFLECIDYGCTNITTKSKNGADDLAVVAILCDCKLGGNGETGNSCIGVINIECDGGDARFDGEVCSGYTECCGMLEPETKAAICKDDVSGSSGLSDGEVAGITIGVLFGVMLFASLVCYCRNQKTLRDQFNKAKARDPYTQKLSVQEEEKDASKGNGIPVDSKSGGYGATSDMDAL